MIQFSQVRGQAQQVVRWIAGPQPELRVIIVLLLVLIAMEYQIRRDIRVAGRNVEYAVENAEPPAPCGEGGNPCHVVINPY